VPGLQGLARATAAPGQPSGGEKQENAKPLLLPVPSTSPTVVAEGREPASAMPIGEKVLPQAAGPQPPWNQFPWWQIPLLFGAVVLTPLLVSLTLALVLRRSGLRFRLEVVGSPGGPLILSTGRVEAGNGVQQDGLPAQGAPARLAGAPDASLAPSEPLPQEPEPTGELFDLGPSYEEEKVARESSLLQQEMGVLQQIFEDNQKLLEEIEGLGDHLTPDEEGWDEGLVEGWEGEPPAEPAEER